MKEKMLMLCYRAPYPIKSGSEIRMYQFVEILSEYYDITLLYLQEKGTDEDMQPLHSKCSQIKGFYVGKIRRFFQSGTGYLFCGKPFQSGYFYSAQMHKWVEEHVKEYTCVLCMHIRTMQYVLGLDKATRSTVKLYLDGIDAITLNFYNSYLASSGIRKLINGLEYKRLAVYERQAFEQVQKSILISARDKDYIINELGADCNPTVIYNYAIDYGYIPDLEKDACTIAFMGKMDYAPNVDAVRFFIEEVYGELKRRYPELQFKIIGGNVAPQIKKNADREGIILCGFVENPAEILQRATIVIAPMISGSGLQNKIVQAMHLGCTVVTTPVGADGLTELSGEEIVVAGNKVELLEKLSYFLCDAAKDERRNIGERARKYIERYYSYERVKQDILQLFTE